MFLDRNYLPLRSSILARVAFWACATTLTWFSLSSYGAWPARGLGVSPVELGRCYTWVKAALASTNPAALPFSFTYGGRPAAELLAGWERTEESKTPRNQRRERTIKWTDRATGLVVRYEAVEYSEYPTVEWTLYFKNTGTHATPILSDIFAADVVFRRGQQSEFLLHHQAGSTATMDDYRPYETVLAPKSTLRLATAGGRGSDACWPYFNVQWGGEGAIVVVGWPGQWAASFSRDDQAGLRIRAGQEQTHFKLLPGEEVRSPLIVLQFWQGDWIHAQNVWRRWMVSHNIPRLNGELPPPLMPGGSSNQMNEMQNANEENQKQFIDGYLDHGVPISFWWMDAGWYPFKEGWWNTGTWEPDKKRFPNGLRAVTDHAHARGIKALVWFEPERVQPGTWLYLNHPEWLLGKDGEQKLLDLGNDAAREWVIDHTDMLMREQGIDIYRQDFNMPPLAYWKAQDTPDRQGISEIKHVTGYLAFWDELRKRHPGLLIDTCASGGRRNDLETLRRSVPLHKSDMEYPNLTSKQTQFYGLAFWEPYFGAPVYPAERVDVYGFRSGLAMMTGLGYDTRRADLDYALLRKLVAQRDLVVSKYYGEYYPLTRWSAEQDAWIGWQFDQPELGCGVVQVFRRPQSLYETARLPLRGLEYPAIYTLTNFDRPGTIEMTGGELLKKGLPVQIPDQPGAAIVTYTRTGYASSWFRPGTKLGFEFDTGTLRGTLHAGGKSLGLTSVIHRPSGKRLDASNGLLSHYRVFTRGQRYGGGAWDWPSTATLGTDGVVEVHWPAAADRPFELGATYRLITSDTIEVETSVHAKAALQGFELFLANYFGEGFTNASVCATPRAEKMASAPFEPLLLANGDWQMFPRDAAALEMIRDGRWKLPPNPVEWTVRPFFEAPLACREDAGTRLRAALFSRGADCFAVASPHQADGHRSVYFSLFGRDFGAGETAKAKVRIWIAPDGTAEQMLQKQHELEGR